ncbi:signal peptidase I [Patescibacteria group bacterium]|nr:signal peptidase I [Patescibacteria group bacterium]
MSIALSERVGYNACITFLMNEQSQKHISADTPAIEIEPKEKGFFREMVEFALIALIIVVPFRIFIAQPYIVNGASMDPTFATGDYLIVDQLSYRFSTPERGSVLIFKYPKDPSWYFIKRVIGLPLETVEINDGVITIKNGAHPEGFVLNEPYIEFAKVEDSTITLKADEYFAVGDNRLGSADSRMWGPVPSYDIVGRPILQILPFKKLGLLPGDKTSLLNTVK